MSKTLFQRKEKLSTMSARLDDCIVIENKRDRVRVYIVRREAAWGKEERPP